MKHIVGILGAMLALASITFAANCYTFADNCGPRTMVCPPWADPQPIGSCMVEWCDDGQVCTTDPNGLTYYQRTRTKYSYTSGGVTYYCITSAHTTIPVKCCNCDGGMW